MFSFFEAVFYIIHNVEIVFRHLTADDVYTIVIRAADDMTFEIGMIRQCEILDRDRNIETLAVREERIIREKRETVGTDIIQRPLKVSPVRFTVIVQAFEISTRGYLRLLLIFGLVSSRIRYVPAGFFVRIFACSQ